ncbi:MAG: hypothetical protein KGD60_14925 [Candidatus Thorarchaeota archaeon]|nr:hypothetical protein [Candidatus Thorarchaeota archaeon]
MTTPSIDCPVKQLTDGYYNHFFGYYDKSNWDKTNRYLLSLRTAPSKRYMQKDDIAIMGLIDSHDEFRFRPITQTTAWNWQQGSQAHWLDQFSDSTYFIHNIRTQNGYASAIVNTKKPDDERVLPLPVYSVTDDNRHALCLNFRRLRYTHPTIGYAEPEVTKPELHPDNDGLFLMDIPSGDNHLIISLEELYQLEHDDSMDDAIHWFTHVNPNPAGNRIAFLHRFKRTLDSETFISARLVTANLDGSDMVVLESDKAPFVRRYYLSHPKWFGDNQVMLWHPRNGHYQLYQDRTNEVRIIGAKDLTENGHASMCPVNPDWMLSDTYPDQEGNHPVFLYQLSTETRLEIAHFHHDPELFGDTRCDLHPRWSRDGKSICVDSSTNNDRQMYLIDISNCPHLD